MKFILLAGFIAWAAAECGVPAYPPVDVGGATGDSEIVGGEEAKPHSWPWQAALFMRESSWSGPKWFQFCGGSLIDSNWVMTAGHCFYKQYDTSNFKIKLGSQNDDTDESTEVTVGISKIIVHPQYNPTTTSHDITLLKLDRAVTFTNAISPVCLPAASDTVQDNQKGVVTGWGATIEGGNTVSNLRQVVVPIVNHGQCQRDYGNEIVDDTMICAGYPDGGKDSCQGDSGGPFVFYTNNRWVQQGIVSWGNGCAEPNYPGVYSRVAAYRDWIDQTMTNN